MPDADRILKVVTETFSMGRELGRAERSDEQRAELDEQRQAVSQLADLLYDARSYVEMNEQRTHSAQAALLNAKIRAALSARGYT